MTTDATSRRAARSLDGWGVAAATSSSSVALDGEPGKGPDVCGVCGFAGDADDALVRRMTALSSGALGAAWGYAIARGSARRTSPRPHYAARGPAK